MKSIKTILNITFLIVVVLLLILGPSMVVCSIWLEGDLFPKIGASYAVIILTAYWFNYIANWASKYK